MQDQPNRAAYWQPPSDALMLAAIDRAERHRGRSESGAAIHVIASHLEMEWGSVASRRLRPRLARLTDELGWLERHWAHSRNYWTLTPTGRRQLAAALEDGIADELPESPQHRVWREARARAANRLDALHADLEAAIAKLEALAEASQPPSSEDWHAQVKPTTEAIKQLALASFCLHEWAEPDDAHADLNPTTGMPRLAGNYRFGDDDDAR